MSVFGLMRSARFEAAQTSFDGRDT